jgi:hypothetical protein
MTRPGPSSRPDHANIQSTISGKASTWGRASRCGSVKKNANAAPIAAQPERALQCAGQQRKGSSDRQSGRGNDAAPPQPVIERGKDHLGRPFVRDPCSSLEAA